MEIVWNKVPAADNSGDEVVGDGVVTIDNVGDGVVTIDNVGDEVVATDKGKPYSNV